MNKRVFLIVSIATLMFSLGVMAASFDLVASASDVIEETEIASFLPVIIKDFSQYRLILFHQVYCTYFLQQQRLMVMREEGQIFLVFVQMMILLRTLAIYGKLKMRSQRLEYIFIIPIREPG